MLDKTYHAHEVESAIYDEWERCGSFRAHGGVGEAFCCILPPPNVTGNLHMGHALNVAIQDVICRFERMRGKDVLWQPGTDHAGIATQMVVERQLMRDGLPGRAEMGRAAFLDKVWEWKARSGENILDQLKRMGASCDWSRSRFTMDASMSKAVTSAFVALYRDGLIYKDSRLVNWDPKLLTAISDLEVEPCEVEGELWYLNYPFGDASGNSLTIATTRPETVFGDVAIAVHPDDPRYRDILGEFVVVPLVGRRIPVIGDEYADPEKGTGAVKITPAHDFNDFEVGRRHDLRMINVFDQSACLFLRENRDLLQDADLAEDVLELHGLDRLLARSRIVELLKNNGFLEKVEKQRHVVPVGDRSQDIIEPRLTEQWYVNARVLAAPALEAVKEGRTIFSPKSWENTYFDWLEGIQPWCISRQLWWGHRIPAWYGPTLSADGRLDREGGQEIFVAKDQDEVLAAARAFYPDQYSIRFADDTDDGSEQMHDDGGTIFLRRDPDVLDTWFSSALWPFSTLGWPEDTAELSRFYPTNILVTGFDIVFFWVARMMMTGLYFTGKEPFHTVYIHALVRDEHGQKMSKSKGNVIDPLELIDEYGADVLRFSLVAMAAQGRDIKLSKGRVEGYRNFITKLWNLSRFAEMNDCVLSADFNPRDCQSALGCWIIGEVASTASIVTEAMEKSRYSEAAHALYQFVWHVFCDWYVEFAKHVFHGDDQDLKSEIRQVTAWLIKQILVLLHPFIPFVTEKLWENFRGPGEADQNMLIVSPWPRLEGMEAPDAAARMDWIVGLVGKIRSVRSMIAVPPKAMIPAAIVSASPKIQEVILHYGWILERMARLESLDCIEEIPEGAVRVFVGDELVVLNLAGIVDLESERQRLESEIVRVDSDIGKINIQLSNQAFLSRAPERVLKEQRERLAVILETREKLGEAIAQVSSALGR